MHTGAEGVWHRTPICEFSKKLLNKTQKRCTLLEILSKKNAPHPPIFLQKIELAPLPDFQTMCIYERTGRLKGISRPDVLFLLKLVKLEQIRKKAFLKSISWPDELFLLKLVKLEQISKKAFLKTLVILDSINDSHQLKL